MGSWEGKWRKGAGWSGEGTEHPFSRYRLDRGLGWVGISICSNSRGHHETLHAPAAMPSKE